MLDVPSLATEIDHVIDRLDVLRRRAVDGTAKPLSRLDYARFVLNARRLRNEMFAPGLFGEPAFDILLDLYVAHLTKGEVSVSSCCIASGVPPTTALRVIKTLVDRALVERSIDPFDGRRRFVSLTEKGASQVARWIDRARQASCNVGT